MIRPIKGGRVSSPYGWRVLNGKKQFHDGIDFTGDDRGVFAIDAGVVVYDQDNYYENTRWTDSKMSGGNMIIVKHKLLSPDGMTFGEYFARYLHLEDNFVKVGQSVGAGETLGRFGDVGYSFGPHLHLDMYDKEWKKIDPTPIIKSIL